MAKKDPAGTINQRADGAVWMKDPQGEGWKQIRDGHGAGVAAGASGAKISSPAAMATNPWTDDQLKYGLDGHLPEETIHPMHVEKDTEGDTDSKPVLQWVDSTGRPRRTYTMAFHRHRALAHHAAIKETGAAAFRTAHAKLKSRMVTAASPKERDAAAAALIHLSGGHRVGDVLGMHAMHTATTLPHQGGEAPDTGDLDVELAKSATEDPAHQHRVHMMFQHPQGHLYPATQYDEGLAEHLRARVSERAGAPTLFECGPEDVRRELDDAGLPGLEEHTVRHHAAMHIASDKLSKLPKPDLGQDYATGVQQLMANLQQVSDEIAEHFGHEPAPQNMSYVPPPIAVAYVEEAGGAKHWPLAFKSQSTEHELEKSACTSQNEATRSSSAPSRTTSARSGSGSTSTATTSRRRSKTRTPSPQSSPSETAPLTEHLSVEVQHAVEAVVVPVETESARVVIGPPQVQRAEYPFVGHILFQGLDIDVENQAGSYREGTDANGHQWRCLMHAHYGEFRVGEGTDGDKLDVYVGECAESPVVVVVRQLCPDTGAYDEDKVMVGFVSDEDAIATYKKQYDRPGFYGGHDVMSIGAFHNWLAQRKNDGKPVRGVLSAAATTGVDVQHSTLQSDEDERLRRKLHKVLGTHIPDPRKDSWRRLAEKALGRAVARVRDGSLGAEVLKDAHESYLRGDHRGCYTKLSIAKSAGAGSAGSTGAAKAGSDDLKPIYSAGQTRGSTSQVNRGRHRIGSGGTGAHPGPDGLPIGSVTTLADGTREQKVGPHEWRRISEATKPAKEEEKKAAENPTLDAAMQELHRLRRRREVASSPGTRHELDQQIEAIRMRIQKLRRGLGKFKASRAAKAEAMQGRSADEVSKERRESTHELAKSARLIAQTRASTDPVMQPWYVQAEEQFTNKLDELIYQSSSLLEVRVNLAKSSLEAIAAAKLIAAREGPQGLDRYILRRLGE